MTCTEPRVPRSQLRVRLSFPLRPCRLAVLFATAQRAFVGACTAVCVFSPLLLASLLVGVGRCYYDDCGSWLIYGATFPPALKKYNFNRGGGGGFKHASVMKLRFETATPKLFFVSMTGRPDDVHVRM